MRFSILGDFAVHRGSTSVALGGRRQQLVLAGLLLHANRTVATDRLIDLVWGEAPPTTARKTLQVYVSRLRQALGDGAISSNGDGYVLHVAADDVDAARFEKFVEETRDSLAVDPTGAAAALREALALRQGPPGGRWVTSPRCAPTGSDSGSGAVTGGHRPSAGHARRAHR